MKETLTRAGLIGVEDGSEIEPVADRMRPQLRTLS